MSVRIRLNTIHSRPRDWHARHTIRHRDLQRAAALDGAGLGLELQEVLHVEGIEGPEDVVIGLGLELAAADGRELVVDEQAPELGGGLGTAADAHDKKVVELGVEGAVEGEFGLLGGRCERVGGRVSWYGVRVAVRASARVRTTGGSSDVARGGVDRSFENGVVQAFNAEVRELFLSTRSLISLCEG
jgi:hypothetical protein